MKRLWTVEVECVSAERKQKTGNGIVCSGSGKFVCKASLQYARKMVRPSTLIRPVPFNRG
jgi:hypothetical protein